MAGPIRKLTPTTTTVAGNQQATNVAAMFHKDWDKLPGAEQGMSRIKARTAQGQKMTPKGAGKMFRSRR